MLSICTNNIAPRADRKCLILIHGAGGQKLDWPETWRAPAAEITHGFSTVVAATRGQLEEFPIYAIDLPGHGASLGAGYQDVADYAEAVFESLRELNPGNIILVGHSMGAAIALQIALMLQDQKNDAPNGVTRGADRFEFEQSGSKICGLGLIAGGAKFSVSDKILDGLQNEFEATVNLLAGASWHRRIGVFGRQQTSLRMRTAGQNIVYGDFLACSRVDLLSQLHRLTLPVRIIAAQDDVMVKLPILEDTAAALPNAEVRLVQDAGHFVHCEHTQEVAKLLAEFSEQV